MQTKFTRHDRVRANKTHKCVECSNIIQAGEHYWNGAYLWPGEGIVSYKVCNDCNNLHQWIFRRFDLEWDDIPGLGGGDLHWEVSEFDDFIKDGWGGLRVEDPSGPFALDDEDYIRLAPWAKTVLEIEDAIAANRYCKVEPYRWGMIEPYPYSVIDEAIKLASAGGGR